MPTPDKQLSAEQSSQIAETIREEIVRRRISRQTLAEQAKLSLSTLEKVLGGRRPFTLATTVRLEQALGVSLRKAETAPFPATAAVNGDIASDNLGAYSHRAVTWLEGTYLTLRPRSAPRMRSLRITPRSPGIRLPRVSAFVKASASMQPMASSAR